MAATIGFGTQWKRAVDIVTKKSEQAAQESFIELFVNIVNDTPVKTGNLRGNWNVSVGGASQTESHILDPTGEKARRAINYVIRNKWKSDQQLFFTNNAPYAELIEYGRSRVQAPYGMVRINIANFDYIVNKWAKIYKEK